MSSLQTTARTLALGLALAAAACGDSEGELQSCGQSSGSNTLDGSFCDVAAGLEFDGVRIRYSEMAQSLEVTYGIGAGEDFSPRLDLLMQVGTITLDDGILVGPDLVFAQRFTENGSNLALVLNPSSRGLTIRDWPGIGGVMRGDVDLLVDVGPEQRTLTGTFEGTVVDLDASFGD